jgi:hypothetical protein
MSNRTIAANSCQLVMAVCAVVMLLLSAFFVWPPFKTTEQWAFAVIAAMQVFALLAALSFEIQPRWSVISGAVLLIVSIVLLWPYPTWGHDPEGLLYQHSLEIVYLAASLAGYGVVRSSKRVKA